MGDATRSLFVTGEPDTTSGVFTISTIEVCSNAFSLPERGLGSDGSRKCCQFKGFSTFSVCVVFKIRYCSMFSAIRSASTGWLHSYRTNSFCFFSDFTFFLSFQGMCFSMFLPSFFLLFYFSCLPNSKFFPQGIITLSTFSVFFSRVNGYLLMYWNVMGALLPPFSLLSSLTKVTRFLVSLPPAKLHSVDSLALTMWHLLFNAVTASY